MNLTEQKPRTDAIGNTETVRGLLGHQPVLVMDHVLFIFTCLDCDHRMEWLRVIDGLLAIFANFLNVAQDGLNVDRVSG